MIEFNDVVKLTDGRFGTVIRLDCDPDGDGSVRNVGIQVPREEEIRWMDVGKLHHVGGVSGARDGAWEETP